jgi:MFS family permease
VSRRLHSFTARSPAGSGQARAATTPRDDLVAEHDEGNGRFTLAEGPFDDYERTVETRDGEVHETVRYRSVLPWYSWVFAAPMRVALHLAVRRRRPSGTRAPWWAPPDRLGRREVVTLGLLASASLSAAFVNTVFTQTANFAADDFGVSSSGQGLGGVVVRLGVVIAIPVSVLADRRGRRRMIVFTAWAAPIVTALGAVAPSFPVLVATQAVGRPLSIALALLISVAVAEEMPRNSRTYALSVLALAGGLGAGVAVGSLPLADLGPGGWRLVYVVALVWLGAAAHLTRELPETRRFQLPHLTAPPLRRGRFALIATVAVSANVFVAPASFFQNRYLDDVRGFSASTIALFTLATATPASLGLVAGGRIAEVVGRRRVLLVCLPVATALLIVSFSTGGPLMWLGALFGGMFSGLAYPAFAVYRTELFPTGNRGRANGWITAISLGGSSIGLVAAGWLVDRGWTYGEAMLVLGTGQLVAAVLAFAAYPETAHLELEQLNPEDPAFVAPSSATS